MTDIVAVIPALDEARTIAGVVEGVLRFCPAIVVDDGSRDGTALRARDAGAHVIRFECNRGKGSALRAGFDEARRRGARAAATLDGDGQHDPEDLPALARAFHESRADLAIGARSRRGMTPLRVLSNGASAVLVSLLARRRIADVHCGMRIVSLDTLAALPPHAHGFGIEAEMLTRFLSAGCRVVQVPVAARAGARRSHIRPLRDLVGFWGALGRGWLAGGTS